MQYISLDTAKSYLRVDFDDEDELIFGLIEAALESCEHHLQQTFTELYVEKDDLPKTIKQATLFLVVHFYENRMAISGGTMQKMEELPLGIKFLLDPHREHPFA